MCAQAWEPISENAKILVRELLTMDPEYRHTAEDTLRSRWLREAPEGEPNAASSVSSVPLQTPAAIRRLKTSDAQAGLLWAVLTCSGLTL